LDTEAEKHTPAAEELKLKTLERKIESWPRDGFARQTKSVVKKTLGDRAFRWHQHRNSQENRDELVPRRDRNTTPQIQNKLEIIKEEQHTWGTQINFSIEERQEYNRSTEVTALPPSFD
jgi:hypothetical protein